MARMDGTTDTARLGRLTAWVQRWPRVALAAVLVCPILTAYMGTCGGLDRRNYALAAINVVPLVLLVRILGLGDLESGALEGWTRWYAPAHLGAWGLLFAYFWATHLGFDAACAP